MKILFTGSTGRQTKDEMSGRALDRINDSSIIVNSLRKQGHTVDRKSVEWGDDLSSYDLAIVGIGQFGSLNYSGAIFKSMWPLAAAKKVLVFHEDWKIGGTVNSFTKALEQETYQKMLDKRFADGKVFYGGTDNPLFDAEQCKAVMQKLVNGEFPALIPAFDWGNKQLVRDIIKSKDIYNVDLTPYVLEHYGIDPNTTQIYPEKQKKHMLASLVDHTAWVKRNKFSWSVDFFGAKSMKDSSQLESERDVFDKCAEYWSILCPEYPHSGSGWFRIRYIYSAINKSILIASKNDLDALEIPKLDIEQMDDITLRDYSQLQSDQILKWMWTKETFDTKINQIVNQAARD
jgi:hypothetical protein